MTSGSVEPAGGDDEAPTAESRAEISKKVEQLFELVPAIGTRWRWYDIPYRFLVWWLTSWRRRLVPRRARRLFNRAMNFFVSFNELERARFEPLDDPTRNLVVPPGEEIHQGGLWAVELFTPSHYSSLEKGLRQNGWESEHRLMLDGTNAEQVRRAREGRGFSWSRIGAVVRPDTKLLVPDAKREKLPEEFDLVELKAIQIGTSVTALVAHFRLSDAGECSLNESWKARHEPRLEWRGFRRPRVSNRYFTAIKATQLERQRIHDLARHWLAKRCGGFFASTEAGHPVIDLNIFNKFDPTTQAVEGSLRDSLRALGMDASRLHLFISDQIPGAVLVPADSWTSVSDPLRNCWGVIGSYERLRELNERPGYGEKPYAASTLGAMLSDAIQAFVLHIAVMRYLEELRAHYSISRDRARSHHGRFSANRLRKLRDEMLTTSIDLPAVARDTETLWDDRWRRWNGIDVKAKLAPGAPNAGQLEYDLIDELGEVRSVAFEELLADDETYRTVLSTVASLGSSADATRTGRIALIVAAMSLLVAFLSLLVSEPGDTSVWSTLGF